jgi:hypothetical protein
MRAVLVIGFFARVIAVAQATDGHDQADVALAPGVRQLPDREVTSSANPKRTGDRF